MVTKQAKKEFPELAHKTFLIGHSMGGTISIQTLVKAKADEFVGAVLSAPAVKVDPSQVTPATLALVKLLGGVLPRLPVDKLNLSSLCNSKAVVDWYMNDPLIYNGRLCARLANELLQQCNIMLVDSAPKINLPFLLVHGTEDHICNLSGSEEFFERVTQVKDKTFTKLQGAMHESLHEKPEHIDVVVKWVASRL